MKIDSGAGMGSLSGAAHRAREAEDLGYDGVMTAEIDNDPFLPLALAAEQTDRVDLITGIAVAFARNPMTLASTAHDIHLLSGGRMVVGLGSQIKPHITKRFSMEWSKPAARMREFVEAMHAIWRCWNDGVKLDFRGEFYSHTLMTPMFTPKPSETGPPKVWLAAVGPAMTRTAAEVCDGIILHGFTTEQYAREVTLPAIEEGLATSGRSRDDFTVTCPSFIVSGPNDRTIEKRRQAVKGQISFYGSTPSYKTVLDHHGLGDLHIELNRLSKEGKWAEMAERIDDEVVDLFAVVADWDSLPAAFASRWAGVIDRTTLTVDPAEAADPAEALARFRAAF